LGNEAKYSSRWRPVVRLNASGELGAMSHERDQHKENR